VAAKYGVFRQGLNQHRCTDPQQLHGPIGNCVGCANATVDDHDLAEYVARAEYFDLRTLAAPPDCTDAHTSRASDDRVNRVGRIAPGKDLRDVLEFDRSASCFDPIEHRRSQAFERSHTDKTTRIETSNSR
jgi:hypothetical protein